MKKEYTEPTIRIVEITASDLLTESGKSPEIELPGEEL